VGDRFGRSLKRVFGSRNERVVRQLEPIIKKISDLEPWAQGLSAEDVKAQTVRWKEQIAAGETDLDTILPDAFALVREACVRTMGMRHFDVQMVGGYVLHEGGIAEMVTGEGKTLVATLPMYLNSLDGKPVYLVTVNDYLARRDCNWMRPIYEYLGCTVDSIQSSMPAHDRHTVYACDIVYGTNNEFGFDYLRDNMKTSVDQQVQKHLHYAIVDEVDSILIDEARTPLIISGPAEDSVDRYRMSDKVARFLTREEHYEVKEKERTACLLETGIEVAEKMVGVESFYTPGNEDWPHYIENALRAHTLYTRDKEYVVEEGEVVIVDEFTGRKMQGRRWSDGLHQAVETKEGIEARGENQTLATITYQNYFRMFNKLAGMTGTALTEAGEFHKIYGLDVVSIPTNLPLVREDALDVVYRTLKEKWKAIVDEIEALHENGQPVLVGTTSIEKSELVSGLLSRRGIKHEVLNAKNHEREATIVCRAGERGAVTVATNMAGRGTDIKLGGNFEFRLKNNLDERGLVEGDEEHLAEIDRVREEVRGRTDADEQEVLALGGLYVLGTERHEARRIDNQLRGRTGRQGDVGISRFYLSLEDDLMRIFYRDWVTNAMEKLGMTEGQEIESGMVSRAIAKAQKKVEDRNFEARKSLLEYDEVMDEQRKTIYSVRQEVMQGIELRKKVEDMMGSCVARSSQTWFEDAEGFSGWYHKTFGVEVSEEMATECTSKGGTPDRALDQLLSVYSEREKEFGEPMMRRVEQYLLLNAVDSRWKDHLKAVDALKAGIGLRGYGQVDPKNEYKKEGFELFHKLLEAVEEEVSSLILRIRVTREPAPGAAGDPALPAPKGMGPGVTGVPVGARAGQGRSPHRTGTGRPPASAAFDVQRRRDAMAAAAGRGGSSPARHAPRATPAPPDAFAGVGRNEACPCGSGKKFKKCHGAG
jgi:preprotein translocase subunit SecA